jgi:hypothetical protein
MFKFNPHFISFFHDWVFPFEITYFEKIFMLACLLNHNANNGILVPFSFMGTLLFLTIIHVLWFWGWPYHLTITKCLNILFLNSYGTQVCSLGIAHSHLGGFMNNVDSKLLRVTQSFVNKSFTKLVKKCFRISFFKLVRSLKKSMACVNIAQL